MALKAFGSHFRNSPKRLSELAEAIFETDVVDF